MLNEVYNKIMELTERQKNLNPSELTAHIVAGLLLLEFHYCRIKLFHKIKNKKVQTWSKYYALIQKERTDYVRSLMKDFYGWELNEVGRNVDILQYNHWRNIIIKRDSYKCSLCSKTKRLEFHHKRAWKDYPEQRYDPDNGVILCHACHIKTESYGRRKIVLE